MKVEQEGDNYNLLRSPDSPEINYIGDNNIEAATINSSKVPLLLQKDKKKPSLFSQILWGFILIWSLLFTFYIFITFFTKPVSTWNTASNYSAPKRATLICIHFVGGVIVLLIGPFQIVQKIRQKNRLIHIWMGRCYLVGVFLVCTAGIAYSLTQLTVGGIMMNVSFALYGVVFLVEAFMAYYYAVTKKFLLHREWAIRTFAVGIGSALYRVYTAPVIISGYTSVSLSQEASLLWLQVAAWLFFIPNMIVCEIYLYRSRNRKQ